VEGVVFGLSAEVADVTATFLDVAAAVVIELGEGSALDLGSGGGDLAFPMGDGGFDSVWMDAGGGHGESAE
jgi:hypothetical protein